MSENYNVRKLYDFKMFLLSAFVYFVNISKHTSAPTYMYMVQFVFVKLLRQIATANSNIY